MSVMPLPSDVHVAPRPVKRSICSVPGQNRFFWVKSSNAPTLFDAFTTYVWERFTDDYQASMAEAEFYARIQRAMRGQLVPVEQVKPMHEAPGVFEIRWNWHDYANGKKQYIGARLFHMEKVMERWIIAAYLMCKKSDTDDLSTYFKQTGGAKSAKHAVEESEPDSANAWEEYRSDEFTLS